VAHQDGLRVMDVSNLTVPTELGSYDTMETTGEVAVSDGADVAPEAEESTPAQEFVIPDSGETLTQEVYLLPALLGIGILLLLVAGAWRELRRL
jgi:hypothetical protein